MLLSVLSIVMRCWCLNGCITILCVVDAANVKLNYFLHFHIVIYSHQLQSFPSQICKLCSGIEDR